MSDTIQKYKDYVMTGFMKSVVPIVIDHASGAVVTDVNGREYLDCFAGISVVNAGHCNPEVIAAAKAAHAHDFYHEFSGRLRHAGRRAWAAAVGRAASAACHCARADQGFTDHLA